MKTIIPSDVVRALGGGDVEAGEKQFEVIMRNAERHFEEMKPFLPTDAPEMLDIGCGPAHLTLLIAKHVGAKRLTVVDGTGVSREKSGYHTQTTPWGDVEMAKLYLETNLPDVSITALQPETFKGFDWKPTVDLVVSTKSWGHHYPIGEYLRVVSKLIRQGGTLVVDLRKRPKTTGLEELILAGFSDPVKISATEKCDRMKLVYNLVF